MPLSKQLAEKTAAVTFTLVIDIVKNTKLLLFHIPDNYDFVSQICIQDFRNTSVL